MGGLGAVRAVRLQSLDGWDTFSDFVRSSHSSFPLSFASNVEVKVVDFP
jgi:hypothetical protein